MQNEPCDGIMVELANILVWFDTMVDCYGAQMSGGILITNFTTSTCQFDDTKLISHKNAKHGSRKCLSTL